MNSTLQAAVPLGQEYIENSQLTKNLLLKTVKQLFQVTEKLIDDQTQTGNLTTIDHKESTWSATSLPCDKAIEITNAKTYVFADLVLCLGTMKNDLIEDEQNLMVFGNS